MIHKVLRKILLDRRFWFRRTKVTLIFMIFIIILKYVSITSNLENTNCDTFDVVYTWVNGSDPEFLKLMKIYGKKIDPARFDDKNELKYSLRSLQKFAPWVRHVFIVTNGQIPHWLDLNYEKVTLVQHSDLVTDKSILPTFSSSAIETFLHRIPGLSKRFLYLNDDIFLNSPLYTEDLYTVAEGVKIYNAWTVPDCAPDCPWVYIGDGSCDEHCNIENCQFDGGDCDFEVLQKTTEYLRKSNSRTISKEKVVRRIKQRSFYQKSRKLSFSDVVKKKNFTNDNEFRVLVERFNTEQKMRYKPRHYENNYKKFPFESTKDIYTHSLIHTNMLLNRIYGFKSRNVLAHVGFLLDVDIINDMENKFNKEIMETSSHRFRDPQDVQFSFLYYNFLMSETYNISISEIFDELDTDSSLTWSDREIRTFLARVYPLPLDWAAVRYFEEVVANCSKELGYTAEAKSPYPTLVYERYEDSNIPTVTKQLVMNCKPLKEVLLTNFAKRPKYKFHLNHKRGIHSNFIMLTSNVTEVVDSLDRLRRNPRKFNCINDNLEPQYPDENQLIRHLLEDFYLSFFPEQSSFELSGHFRNRFLYLDDYNRWKNEKRITLIIGYFLSAIFSGILFKYFCFHKAKYARKYIPYKCRDI